MRRFSSLALAVSVLASIAACSGRPFDLGGGGSTTTMSATGGASSTTSATGGSASSSSSSSASSSSSSGAGGADAGPTGPTTLTVVNGLNDYPAIRICFVPDDNPWPSAATGLPFAAAQAVTPLDTTIPTGGDVTPWIIAGDLTQTAGKTCAQILALANDDAGATGLLARPLAVIPKVVWSSQKSLLMVPYGCLGGPGHDDPNNVCGNGYAAATGNATVALVSMSRVEDPNHVSLQAVSASAPLPEVDVRVLPNLTGATAIGVAYGLTKGAIGPTPPFTQLTLNEYGALDGVQIHTYTPGTSSMSSSVLLPEILANGGVASSAIDNGARLVLVAVGAAPGVPAGDFWHAFTYVMVKAD